MLRVDPDDVAVRQNALHDGALVNTKLHDRIHREQREEAKNLRCAAAQGRKPQYTNKAFSANLDIDAPADMQAVMAAAKPHVPPRRQNDEQRLDKRKSVGAPVRRRHRMNGGVGVAYGGPNALDGEPVVNSAYLRHLTNRLEEYEGKRKLHESSRASRSHPNREDNARPTDTTGAREQRALASAIYEEGRAARKTGCSTSDWVSQQIAASPITNRTSSRSRSSSKSGSRCEARDGVGLRAQHRTELLPNPSLLVQLSAGRFPRTQYPKRAEHGAWLTDTSDARQHPPLMNTGHRDADAQHMPSVLMTEVVLQSGDPGRDREEEAGNRPHSAGNATRDGEGLRPTRESCLSPALLQRLHQEPIHSYRVLRDVTVRPASALLPRTAALNKTLVGSGKLAQENYSRNRHAFESTRYVKQAELLTFLDWRRDCRSAVCRAATATAARGGSTSAKEGTAASAAAAGRILQTLERAGCHSAPHPSAFAGSVHGPCGRRQEKDAAPKSLQSAWTRTATVLSVEQAREQVCQRLEAFTLDFPAASISREAMEHLRAEVVVKVRQTPAPLMFSRKHLKQFLLASQRRTSDGASQRRDGRTADQLSEADVVDTMPSAAEAAFVRFAFDTLP